jgi:hypothetical protein
VTKFKAVSQHLPAETEESHGKPQSGKAVGERSFESGTSSRSCPVYCVSLLISVKPCSAVVL